MNMQKYEVLVDDFEFNGESCVPGQVIELDDDTVAPLLAEGRLAPYRDEAGEDVERDFDAEIKDASLDDEDEE